MQHPVQYEKNCHRTSIVRTLYARRIHRQSEAGYRRNFKLISIQRATMFLLCCADTSHDGGPSISGILPDSSQRAQYERCRTPEISSRRHTCDERIHN